MIQPDKPMTMSEQHHSERMSARRETEWRKAAPSLPRAADTSLRAREPAGNPGAMEEALHQAIARLRALLSVLPEPVFVIRRDGMVLESFLPPDGELRFSDAAVVGRRVGELLPAALAQQGLYHVEKALRTGQAEHVHGVLDTPEGPRDFQARICACSADAVVVYARDVTERKLREKEVAEISNREQMRIGQDLHDGLGQHLTGITFLTRALEHRLAAQARPEAAEVGEIGRLVMQALSHTRSLARGLFPVELESSGLVRALQDLAATLQQIFEIECTVECPADVTITDPDTAKHLFRLAQEAINNSVRHGKARRVHLRLAPEGAQWALTIQDDGAGFPADAPQGKGLGLRIMNYRAQRIGGTLSVTPGEHGGVTVCCRFPAPVPPP